MSEPIPWQDAVRQQPRSASLNDNKEVQRRSYARWTMLLSVVNVVVMLVAVILILDFSDDWWLSGLLVHLPQVPLLVPSLALLACSLVWHLRSSLINATCFVLVLFTLCGYRVSLKPLAKAENATSVVRVATCHVLDNPGAVERLIERLRTRQVDLMAFQGLQQKPVLDEAFFPRWQTVKEGPYWVASRWPVSRVSRCESKTFERMTGINIEIEHPRGTFVLSNLELTSSADELNQLSLSSLVTGSGKRMIEAHLARREHEAFETRRAATFEPTQAQLIVGDFGVHPSSKVFRRYFGQLTDSFDTAGVSFGYTTPQLGGRFWPPRVAWMRSDMILSTAHWEPLSCNVIEAPGLDHNAVLAELRWKGQ